MSIFGEDVLNGENSDLAGTRKMNKSKDLAKEKLLQEFIDWARDCGEEVFYIFDDTEEAIERFMKERKNK